MKKTIILVIINIILIISAVFVFLNLNNNNYVIDLNPFIKNIVDKMPEIKASDFKCKHDYANFDSKVNDLLNKSFTQDELSKVAISFNIVDCNYKYDYNNTKLYPSASTIKVPINMYIYDLAKKDPSILNKYLTYTDKDKEEGAGILQYKEVDTSYKVKDLLDYSIIYSDNVANNILIRNYITSYSNNLKPYFSSFTGNNSTSDNRMYCLNKLYLNQSNYSTILKNMKNTIYNNRIPLYLPDNVIVAHKTGDLDGIIHDYGIVYNNKDGNDYLITLSMDNISNQDSRMALLSRDLFNLINTQ